MLATARHHTMNDGRGLLPAVLVAASIALLCLPAAHAIPGSEMVTVKTKAGPIVGVRSSLAVSYRGVQYATAKRWQAPQPPPPFTTPFNANADGPGCIQSCNLPTGYCPTTQSEDCLWLNVFTPHTTGPHKPWPVLVFLHGGRFEQGTAGSPWYNGTVFANQTESVVVVVNYRVGALGFASLGAGAPINGSYGYLDQIAALQYVQANALAFGADSKRVTLFGQGSGALSVAALMSTTASKQLFSRAILGNPAMAAPFRNQTQMATLMSAFAYYANCTGNATVVASCLTKLSTDAVLTAQTAAAKNITATGVDSLMSVMPWTPIRGDRLIPVQPLAAWSQGDALAIPVIVTFARNSSEVFVYREFPSAMSPIEYPVVLSLVYSSQIGNQIVKQYPPPPGVSDLRPLADQVTLDSLFMCPARNATLASPPVGMAVFFSVFNHVSSFNKAYWGSGFEYCARDVCHGADIPYIFQPDLQQLVGSAFTADEQALATALTQYYGNFVDTGAPGSALLPRPSSLAGREAVLGRPTTSVTWPAFTAMNEAVLEVGAGASCTVSVSGGAFGHKCAFWNGIGYKFS